MEHFPGVPGYKILAELGKGGMARVYLAYEEKLEREVALKVLLRSLTEEEEITKRFLKEAKTAARLRHSNIVSIYDVGQVDDTYYFAMERLEGSLKERIGTKAQAPLQPFESLAIIQQLAAALGYAHDEGLIHRDIKPQNILFRADGTPVLVDFGIAKAVDSSTKTNKTWLSAGTPYYMGPEQINGEELDGRADIYSLGVVLFEMLTGGVPYDGPNFISISMKHINEPVPSLPEPLKQYQPLIDRMMAKERENRPADCRELSDLLDDYLHEPEPSKEYMGAAAARPARRSWPVLLVSALVLLLCSALLVYFFLIKPAKKEKPLHAAKDDIKVADSAAKEPAAAVPVREAEAQALDLNNLARVRMPECIRRVQPIYPEAAIKARVEGKVVIDAATDTQGQVVKTVVVSGNPLLAEAALEAIKQWRYKPYLLNKRPIPVVFSVTLDFRLDEDKDSGRSQVQEEEPEK